MSSSATDTNVQVAMPQMGISVSEGTILEWRKSVGDTVAADETICDVTTDKVDVEIPCPATGVLARILAEPGDTVPVGQPIAEIDTGGPSESEASRRDPAAQEPDEIHPDNGAEVDRSRFVSPVVRRMADEHDVDLERVEGHGVGGRIRKKDLIAYLEHAEAPAPKEPRKLHTESPYVPDSPAPATASNGDGRREPMSPMRKAIADHMVRS